MAQCDWSSDVCSSDLSGAPKHLVMRAYWTGSGVDVWRGCIKRWSAAAEGFTKTWCVEVKPYMEPPYRRINALGSYQFNSGRLLECTEDTHSIRCPKPSRLTTSIMRAISRGAHTGKRPSRGLVVYALVTLRSNSTSKSTARAFDARLMFVTAAMKRCIALGGVDISNEVDDITTQTSTFANERCRNPSPACCKVGICMWPT